MIFEFFILPLFFKDVYAHLHIRNCYSSEKGLVECGNLHDDSACFTRMSGLKLDKQEIQLGCSYGAPLDCLNMDFVVEKISGGVMCGTLDGDLLCCCRGQKCNTGHIIQWFANERRTTTAIDTIKVCVIIATVLSALGCFAILSGHVYICKKLHLIRRLLQRPDVV